ncbi:2-oxoacid:acceptor oxidoreductase subunit alpha [Motiliproteus sp. SC1-56]|uniref:2-oxoacid:acceptor oxidoreductase subunit alpha n=1 Tax=Motiliproteus sp. SC1-56 TaxID=2799565 RepID=UPI001A8CEC83|nr:2-oxoacid:acceptor oxidoreductase subunit alpha [Motiliproteus sp. SC1-56]
MTVPSISITLTGSGGSGVMTAGNLLLEAAGRAGWYGLMTRSAGPQIRGGEAAAMLRLAAEPVLSHQDRYDILLGIDWKNADRFATEIPLDGDSLVVGDGEPPAVFAEAAGQQHHLELQKIAKEIPGGRPNMVALGVAAAMLGLPESVIAEVLEKALGRKGEEAVSAGLAAVRAGMEAAATLPRFDTLAVGEASQQSAREPRWNISGNEACGLGAVRGGIRFVAAYPITPATEVLEWLAPALPKLGGALVQAEDELASVNQIIGGSFGGTPSLTATSGPGLALMMESIGLAVASETPIVVINVMRGGPSTGIPTKSEQSDLNIALYGLHGDAPHLVLAPLSIADCLFTTQWSVVLAEKLQTAAIVLSDQALGQTRTLIPAQADPGLVAERLTAQAPVEGNYERYALTESGVSPMAIPGLAGAQYTADGLEHTVTGMPSSKADDHHRQMDKRQRKLEQHDFGDDWARIEGDLDAETAVLTWGSSYGAVSEAVAGLRGEGQKVRVVAIRLLAPAQPERLAEALKGVKRVLVVEQSHGGQFFRYLRAFYDIDAEMRSMAVPGPLAIRPSDVRKTLSDWS